MTRIVGKIRIRTKEFVHAYEMDSGVTEEHLAIRIAKRRDLIREGWLVGRNHENT